LKAFFISGSLTSISADATATSLVKNQRNNSPPILQANHCEQVCPAQTHPASKQVRMRVFLDWQECYSARNCRARRFVSRVGEKRLYACPKLLQSAFGKPSYFLVLAALRMPQETVPPLRRACCLIAPRWQKPSTSQTPE